MGWILSSNLEDGLNFHLRIAVQIMAIPTTQEARTAMMVKTVRELIAAPPIGVGGLLEEELAELVTVWYSVDGSAAGGEDELAGGLEGAGGERVEADEGLDEAEDNELGELELEKLEELELDGLEAEDDGMRSERPGRPTKDELLDRLLEEAGGEEGDGPDGEGSPAASTVSPPSNPLGIRFRIMRFTSA